MQVEELRRSDRAIEGVDEVEEQGEEEEDEEGVPLGMFMFLSKARMGEVPPYSPAVAAARRTQEGRLAELLPDEEGGDEEEDEEEEEVEEEEEQYEGEERDEEEPAAEAQPPAPPRRHAECDECGLTRREAAEAGRKLSRCAGCMAVHYCSTRCQRKSWLSHKQDCQRLAAARREAEAAVETAE